MGTANLETDLSRLREQIARIRHELSALDDDALPPAEWRERLLAWVDREAAAFDERARFELTSARVLYNGHQTEVTALDLTVRPGIGDDLARVSGAGILCWLMRDTLVAKIDAIVAETDYEFGLPLSERPARRRKLQEQLDRIEAEEEFLIRALETAGREIDRRPDARPELVLSWPESLDRLRTTTRGQAAP